ncbi:hypothetical protein RI054_14g67750 [Pseudoscourfieldia marina]
MMTNAYAAGPTNWPLTLAHAVQTKVTDAQTRDIVAAQARSIQALEATKLSLIARLANKTAGLTERAAPPDVALSAARKAVTVARQNGADVGDLPAVAAVAAHAAAEVAGAHPDAQVSAAEQGAAWAASHFQLNGNEREQELYEDHQHARTAVQERAPAPEHVSPSLALTPPPPQPPQQQQQQQQSQKSQPPPKEVSTAVQDAVANVAKLQGSNSRDSSEAGMVASAFHAAASATALGDAAAAGRFAAAAAATLDASRFAQARMAAIAAGRACGDDADKVRAAGDAAAAAATLAGADEDEAEAAREAGMHIYASHEEEAVPPDAVTAAEEAASRAAASIIIERGVDADSAVTAEATAAVAAAAITSAVAAGAPVSQAAMIAGVAAAKALRSVRRQNDGAVQMTLQQSTSQPEQHVPEEVGFLEAESTMLQSSREESSGAGWGSPIRSFLDTIAQVRAGVQDAARLEVIISHGLALAHEQALEGSSSMRAAAARRTFDEKVEHALSHNASTWETEMDAEQFADSVNRIELAVENLTLALAEEEKSRAPVMTRLVMPL